MAEGGGYPGDPGWWNFGDLDTENLIVDPGLRLYHRPQNMVTEGNRQEGVPTTVTATPVTANTEPTSQTVTTNQTLENQDNIAPYDSDFARQLVQEDLECRLSSVPMTNPQRVNANETLDRTPAMSRIRPFTIDERNWFRDMSNTVGDVANEEEMNVTTNY